MILLVISLVLLVLAALDALMARAWGALLLAAGLAAFVGHVLDIWQQTHS